MNPPTPLANLLRPGIPLALLAVSLLQLPLDAAKYKNFRFPDGYVVPATAFEQCDGGHYFSGRIVAGKFLKFNMPDQTVEYATKTCAARTLEFRSARTLEFRSAGTLEFRSARTLEFRSEGEAVIKAGQTAAGENLMRTGCDGDNMVACSKFAEYLIAVGRPREALPFLDRECSIRGLKCTDVASLRLGNLAGGNPGLRPATQAARTGGNCGGDNDPEYFRFKHSAEEGSMRDTCLAAARLCECQLQAGGCGSNRAAWQEKIRNCRQHAAALTSNAPAVRR